MPPPVLRSRPCPSASRTPRPSPSPPTSLSARIPLLRASVVSLSAAASPARSGLPSSPPRRSLEPPKASQIGAGLGGRGRTRGRPPEEGRPGRTLRRTPSPEGAEVGERLGGSSSPAPGTLPTQPAASGVDGSPQCLLPQLPQIKSCGLLARRLFLVGPAGFALWILEQSAGSGEEKIRKLGAKKWGKRRERESERQGRQEGSAEPSPAAPSPGQAAAT